MPILDPAKRKILEAQGLNPDEYSLVSEQPQQEDNQVALRPTPNVLRTTATGSFGRSALEAAPSVLAGTGATIGTGALLGSTLGPVGTAVGALGAGLAVAAGFKPLVQDPLFKKIDPADFQRWQSIREADIQEHPTASLLGNIAAMGVAMKPSVGPIKEVLRGGGKLLTGGTLADLSAAERGAALNLGLGAGIMPAMSVGESLITGAPMPSLGELAIQSAGGALFNEPNALGRRMGLTPTPMTPAELARQLNKQVNAPGYVGERFTLPEEPVIQPKKVSAKKARVEEGQKNLEIDRAIAEELGVDVNTYRHNTDLEKQASNRQLWTDVQAGKTKGPIGEAAKQEELPTFKDKELEGNWNIIARYLGKQLDEKAPLEEQLLTGNTALMHIANNTNFGKAIIKHLIDADILPTKTPENLIEFAKTVQKSKVPKKVESPAGVLPFRPMVKLGGESGEAPPAFTGMKQEEVPSEGVKAFQEKQKEVRQAGPVTTAWYDLMQKLGVARNIKLTADNKLVNESGKPIGGIAYLRQGLKEASAKINPNVASIDTPVHELQHIFMEDLRTGPSKSGRALVDRGETIVKNSPDYKAWSDARKANNLNDSVTEYMAELGGLEGAQRVLGKEGEFANWVKDFKSYMKLKAGHGASGDYARLLSNRLIYEKPFAESHLALQPKVTAPLEGGEERGKEVQQGKEEVTKTPTEPSGASKVAQEEIPELSAKKEEAWNKLQAHPEYKKLNDEAERLYDEIGRIYTLPFEAPERNKVPELQARIDELNSKIYELPENKTWWEEVKKDREASERREFNTNKEKLKTTSWDAPIKGPYIQGEDDITPISKRLSEFSAPAHGTTINELESILANGLNKGSALDHTPSREWASGMDTAVIVPLARKGRKIEHNNYYESGNRTPVAKAFVDSTQLINDVTPRIIEISSKHPEIPIEVIRDDGKIDTYLGGKLQHGEAPAKYVYEQPVPAGMKPFDVYRLTEDIEGHPKGSDVAGKTLEKLGYKLPAKEPTEPEYMLQEEIPTAEPSPEYYSRLQRAVEGMDTQKPRLTPLEWNARLTNLAEKKGAFKMRELEDSGLRDFLKGKDFVTKKEVLDYLHDKYIDEEEIKLKSEHEIRQAGSEAEKVTPGLTQRHAIVLTDRGSEPYGDAYHYGQLMERRQLYPSVKELNEAALKLYKIGYGGLNPEQSRQAETLAQSKVNEIVDNQIKRGTISFMEAGIGKDAYTGEPVYVIEQLQSPRHQEGREEGYKSDIDKLPVIQRNDILNSLDAYRYHEHYYVEYKDDPREVLNKRQLLQHKLKMEVARDHLQALLDTHNIDYGNNLEDFLSKIITPRDAERLRSERIPDAPYKDTRDWVRRGIKTALNEAVKRGIKKLAWPTGEAQAEYAGKLDILSYWKTPDGKVHIGPEGKYGITALSKDELAHFLKSDYSDDTARSLAEKLWTNATEETQTTRAGLEGSIQELIYDKIMKQELNKYAEEQKWPGRVGSVDIDKIGRGRSFPDYNTRAEAEDAVRAFKLATGYDAKIFEKGNKWNVIAYNQFNTLHSFDITPEVEQTIKTQGQPRMQEELPGTPHYQEDVASPVRYQNQTTEEFAKKAERAVETPEYRRSSILPLTASRFDKVMEQYRNAKEPGVRQLAIRITDALHKFGGMRDLLTGRFGNKVIAAMQGYNPNEMARITKFLWEGDQELPHTITPSAHEQNFIDQYKQLIKEARILQNEWGLKVKVGKKFRVGGIRPEGYFPNIIDQQVPYEWAKDPTSAASRGYVKTYEDFLVKKGMPLNEAKKLVHDYQMALGNRMSPEDNFGAIRKAEGIGLPWELTEKNLAVLMTRYARRAARDLSYWRYLQSNPEMRKALNLPDLAGHYEQVTDLPDIPVLSGNETVQQALHDVFPNYRGGADPRVDAFARLAANVVMGPGTAARNLLNMSSFIAQYGRPGNLPGIIKGITNALSNANGVRARAFADNAIRPDFRHFDAAGNFNGSPNPIINYVNKMSDFLRRYQGRDLSNKLEGLYYYSIGEQLATANIAGAKQGNKEALEFMRQMGDLVEGGWKRLLKPGEVVTPDDVARIAKRFTDHLRGTYTGEGLPSFAIEGKISPFTALSRFSLEKANTIWKDVVEPMRKGIYGPALRYFLGSVLTGAAISKLNEVLTHKKGPDATVSEIQAAEGTPVDYAHRLVGLLQLASFAGSIGDSLKLSSNALQGKGIKIGNPLSFPLYTLMTDTIGQNTVFALDALGQGEDPVKVIESLLTDIGTQSSQSIRYLDANLFRPEEAEKKEKFRDLRVFNQLSGAPAAGQGTANPYLNLEGKEYKKEPDLAKAVEMVPQLIDDALKASTDRAGNLDFELFQKKLRSIKQDNYQTLPSPLTAPLSFRRYIDYLSQSQGADVAEARVKDYFEKMMLRQVKSAMIP